MKDILTRISNIQFDGTFFAVPIQFYQFWTLFVTFDNHTLPAYFCLMTGKEGQLYTAVLDNISSLIPQFQPKLCMSDWEPAPRNSMKEVYPNVKIYGCWFHFTQCIWTKTQKLGLVKSFREHQQLATYIRHLMAIPFLPACHILSTFTFLESPTTLPAAEEIKLEKLKKYFRKRWIGHICPEELSIFDAPVSTNNGAESFHSKLKRRVKCGHPRVWNFMNILNEIIIDTDNEIGRLCSGKEISRTRKRIIVNCSTLFLRNCQLFDSIFEELSIVRLYLRGIVNCSTLFWYRYLKLYVFVTLSTEIISLIVMQQLS